MIISRTPFRVSFVGGGTDLREFYAREPGLVVSAAIDKYMYITVNKRFDDSIRVSYSKTEIVQTWKEIRHPIVKAALEITGVTGGVEITSIADVPAGTGMGSSSSFTVGLLNALYAFRGQRVAPEQLAREASRIEIEMVKEPIGKQDQYAAAFGGMNAIQFSADESVVTRPVVCTPEVQSAFEARLMMFYTGVTREAKSILAEQRHNTQSQEGAFDRLKKMRDLAKEMERLLRANRLDQLDDVGDVLHQGWMLKKGLARGIAAPEVDQWYDAARQAGAKGGKLLGAGGGGFLLFYVPVERKAAVRSALALREFPFHFESAGSTIIFVSR